MAMICAHCGRDLDEIGQDNVSKIPGVILCEDCEDGTVPWPRKQPMYCSHPNRIPCFDSASCRGYLVRDLVALTETLGKLGITPVVLKSGMDAFTAGYRQAQKEMDEALQQQFTRAMKEEGK